MILMILQMTKINQIWKKLENDKSFTKGLLFRRYSASVLPDVFLALQQPEKLFCIAVSVSKEINVNISHFTKLKEIDIDFSPDPNKKEKNVLIFKLINSQHKDIFSVLCEDMITSIANESNERKLIKEILNRFEKWKSLFGKISAQGLTPEEQRGLYGELYFLRKFLNQNTNHLQIINSWTGTEKDIRDFQLNNWAVEVKTTFGSNHQKVYINNERQLDTTHLDKLYLYHISLEQAQQRGETLNKIINSFCETLKDDTLCLNRFKSKLYEAGYFEYQAELYNNIGYSVRQNNYYKVEDEFPRIQENEIRNGIGDVKYSVILSLCESYRQSEKHVFENLNL